MQINFDNVPKSNPMSGYFTPGFYKGVVKKTEVKVDKNNKEFLTIVFNLFTPDGTPVGVFSDFVRDTTSDVPLYKLGRMLQAMGLNLTGVLDLKMLARVIPIGREVAMEIGDNEYQGKTTSQVKIFDSQCYWPVTMLQGLVAAAATPGAVAVPAPQAVTQAPIPPNPAEFPFDAADGVVPPVGNAPTQAAVAPAQGVGDGNY